MNKLSFEQLKQTYEADFKRHYPDGLPSEAELVADIRRQLREDNIEREILKLSPVGIVWTANDL